MLNVYAAKNVATCVISEKDLLGAWASSGASDFEEMAFDVYEDKHAFMSCLHHHPEMSGTWSLDNCQLHIEVPSEPKLSFDYRIKKIYKESLISARRRWNRFGLQKKRSNQRPSALENFPVIQQRYP